jgi:hypothetical protein
VSGTFCHLCLGPLINNLDHFLPPKYLSKSTAGVRLQFQKSAGLIPKALTLPICRARLKSWWAAPNAVVEPIHPKAVAVILTTDEERDVWIRAVGRGEGAATPLADDALKIVARGAEKIAKLQHDASAGRAANLVSRQCL